MAKKEHGLGRGLGALLPDRKNISGGEHEAVQKIALTEIKTNPAQPRKDFDAAALSGLADSIRQYGILQPLLVRRLPQGYGLIAGERRYRAAKMAGLQTVPVIIGEYSDVKMTEVALIENLQRADLNVIEEALAYDCLQTGYGMTQDMIAHKVGRSRSHITNFLRLLRLPDIVREDIAHGNISMGQAKPLLSLDDENLQIKADSYIKENELSARQVEILVKKLIHQPDYLEYDKTEQKVTRELFVTEAEEKLKMFFGTQVKIYPGKKKSKIEIEFYSVDDLDRIIETLLEQRAISTEEKKALLRQVSTTKNFSV